MDFRGARRSRKAYFACGVLHCIRAPGIGLFAAMAGFGALARESGLSFLVAMGMTGGLWSTPGQVAFAELFGAGVGGLALVASVTIANVRMFPLTIATIPLLRTRPGRRPLHFLMAHANSVTSFVQVVEMSRFVSDKGLRAAYFAGFTTAAMSLGLLGTAFGHAMSARLPVTIGQAMMLVTPLFMLLLAARSEQRALRMAVVFGCALVPLGHLVSSDWGLIAGGALAGTAAFAFDEARKRRA